MLLANELIMKKKKTIKLTNFFIAVSDLFEHKTFTIW